jgi:hypothetical protein
VCMIGESYVDFNIVLVGTQRDMLEGPGIVGEIS